VLSFYSGVIMTNTEESKLSDDELMQVIRARTAKIANLIYDATQGAVQRGPFAGQVLLKEVSWGGGDLSCKLLGCYEAELHPAIEHAIQQNPDIVINVGCAEGYYAIGLAQRLPMSQIHAFDISELAQEVCHLGALINEVKPNITVKGECTAQDIVDLVKGAQIPLIILDCEGAEIDLITPENSATLEKCNLIIECHDFINDKITPTLIERLSPTHNIEIITEGARNPSSYDLLHTLGSLDRWLAVCEFRPSRMHWMIATPKR